MKKKIFSMLVLLMTAVTGAWAQEAPTVTPTENKNEWTFTMPDYAVVAKIEYDTELALSEVDDNAAKLDEWDGYEANITLTRTKLTGGMWNTLTLPFKVDAQNLADLKTLLTQQGGSIEVKKLASTSLANDGKTLMLNFEPADEIEAGKPYLVKVSKDVNLADLSTAIDAAIALGVLSANPFKDAEIKKDPVPVTTTYADFIPTLGKTLVTGPTGDEDNEDAVLFVAANNKLKNPSVVNDPSAANDASYMKGFRAYFQLHDAAEARAFKLNLDDDATGVGAIDNGELKMDNSVYDLQGRKVEKAQKGVYIVNGKKVIK